MTDDKTSRFRFGRKSTVGALGGVVGAMILYLTFLLFGIAITGISASMAFPIVMPPIELAGLPLGFGAGALIALEEFGE